ncbi:hypothetical protein DFJ74DRAFT_682085 [Hyaloraphidium curvatum]|nr:hypothetical protein DFJ74DRAFT_682085 [Hyaloraphidium curvatum]
MARPASLSGSEFADDDDDDSFSDLGYGSGNERGPQDPADAPDGSEIWAFVEHPPSEMPGYYPRRKTPTPPAVAAEELCEVHGARQPCAFLVSRPCHCPARRPVRNLACFKTKWPGCGGTCSKPRHCGHPCTRLCHIGECDGPCGECRRIATELLRAIEDDRGTETPTDFAASSAGTPAPSSPSPPDPFPFEYSAYLLEFYYSNPRASLSAERALRALCAAGAGSHHFPPASRPHRKFLHTLAELFGLESESLDPEPMRSVVVRVPVPGRGRRKADAEEGSDGEVKLVRAGRFGIPSLGLKEAALIWRKTGKLARLPLPESEAAPSPLPETGAEAQNREEEEAAVDAEGTKEDDTPAPETEPAAIDTRKSVEESPREKRRRKKGTTARIVEGPKAVVTGTMWDVLGEEEG